MRPIIVAEFVRIEGVKPLLAAQFYDKHGDYQTSIVAPCADPILAVQVALEMAEFAGHNGIIDFQTSDRGIFAAAMQEPDINAEIFHPSETAHVHRMVTEDIESYRDFYPDEKPASQQEFEELTGWRAWVVQRLKGIINKLEKRGNKQ